MYLLTSASQRYNLSGTADKFGCFFQPIAKGVILQAPCEVASVFVIDSQSGMSVSVSYDFAFGIVQGQPITNIRISTASANIPFHCFYFRLECNNGTIYYTEEYAKLESYPEYQEVEGYFNCEKNYLLVKSEYYCEDLNYTGQQYDSYYGIIPSASGNSPLLVYDNGIHVKAELYWAESMSENEFMGAFDYPIKATQKEIDTLLVNELVPPYFARMIRISLSGTNMTIGGVSYKATNGIKVNYDVKNCRVKVEQNLQKRKKVVYFACGSCA